MGTFLFLSLTSSLNLKTKQYETDTLDTFSFLNIFKFCLCVLKNLKVEKSNVAFVYKINKKLPFDILIILLICILILFANIKIQSGYLTQILKALGNLTYSSYLVHVPIQLIIIL